MLRTITFSLVILAIISILMLMHLYVYRRIITLFALSKAEWLFTAFLLMALSFPLAMFLSRTVDGPLIRVFYGLAATWLGFVFLGLMIFGVLHLTQLLFRLAGHLLMPMALGWASIALTILIGIYGLVNASVVRTTEATIGLDKMKEPKVTIALLTDIHVGAVYGPKYLQKIVNRTNALNPDLVVIAGDLFDGSAKPAYGMVQPLENLKAPAFFVTGNHEVYEGVDITTGLVARTGVKVLRNEITEFRGLQIVGIEAPSRESRKNTGIEGISEQLDKTLPVLLLYHIPLGLEQAKAAGVDLQLSGHTHNGQLFPFNLIMPLIYRFYKGLGREVKEAYVRSNPGAMIQGEPPEGMKEQDDFFIYVSQGVGTWGPPMRIGTRSEIIKINLIPAVP